MADPDPQTLDEVRDEWAFTDVLIASLDERSDTYHHQLAQFEARKAHLATLWEAMEKATQTQQQVPSQDMSGGVNGTRESLQNNPWWNTTMGGRPSSTHSTHSAASFSNSSGLNDPFGNASTNGKRARPQSSFLDSPQQPNKRQTPEPSYPRMPDTMGTSYGQLSSRPTDRVRLQQYGAENAFRRQHQQLTEDAEFARRLSHAADSRAQPTHYFTSSRPSVQTTLNYNGSYQRPSAQVKAESSSSSSSRAQNQGYNSPPGYPSYHGPSASRAVKTEPGYPMPQLASRPRRTAQVVDLTGSDPENSDDDLTEIQSTRFQPNIRNPTPNAPTHQFGASRSLYQPTATTIQRPNTMQQMPGSYPTSIHPDRRYVNGINATLANGSTNPWFAQTVNDFTSAARSLASPFHELQNLVYGASSSRPLDLDSDGDDDDDDDEVIYGGSRQVPGYGRYLGNEALYRDRYDAFAAHDATKTKEEIQALLENIRPDEEMPAHLRVQSPSDLSCRLHKYQELGLTWLKNCEEGSNKGGILADDMGLGKTIQMLALMVTRKSDDPRCKTTLIIAPVALMRQWAQEIRNKIKSGRSQLTVFTHHGSKKAKSFNDLRTYDVVLTTYGSIASELKKLQKFQLRKAQDSSARPYANEKCLFLDPDSHWYRIILDEAQCIKNRQTQASKSACLLKAKYRFCVTGTPMMNNVEELFSLIQFLKIKPYCHWEKFRLDINNPLRQQHEETKMKAMQMLQALCKAVMLRRTKKSHFEGQPILVLPERSTEVDHPVFSEDERDFYTALETRSQLQMNKYLRRGTVGRNYSAILVLLLRLRQACCHPHLIKDFGVAAAADLDESQMIEFARELEEPVVARIKETGGNFECPVCYDVTPNPAIFIPCGHDTCSECFSKIADPANAIQNGDEAAGVRCPNCRGPIDSKRLTDFNSFKRVHMPELLTEAERGESEAVEGQGGSEPEDEDESDSETEDDDLDEEEEEDPTLDGFIVDEDVEDDPDERGEGSFVKEEEGVGRPSNGNESKKSGSGKGKGKAKIKAKKRVKGKSKQKKKANSAMTLAELKKLAARSKAHKKAYLRRLRSDYVGSAKIDKTLDILRNIMEDTEGEKVLIFSQWTSLLDLLEIPIDAAGYGYRRYDGSMSASLRGDAVDDFRDERQNVRIMLISLKAGNAGLNLTMASQVIILDPFWNPYIEEQAIDRAHRFGQQRPVKIHRVLIENTVEDRIIELQEKKRALISEALDEGSAKALSRLGVQELAYLFNITNDPAQRINYAEHGRR